MPDLDDRFEISCEELEQNDMFQFEQEIKEELENS